MVEADSAALSERNCPTCGAQIIETVVWGCKADMTIHLAGCKGEG